MWQIIGIIIVAISIIIFVLAYAYNYNQEIKKYYAAAYKMVKEECLELALKNKAPLMHRRPKQMVYLKWNNGKKQGYVFQPEKGIRIGRLPERNEICIQENSVSGEHCILYISGNQLAVQDFHSANGTWLQRGFSKHCVQGAEYVTSGDVLQVGSVKIKIIIFWIDTSNI